MIKKIIATTSIIGCFLFSGICAATSVAHPPFENLPDQNFVFHENKDTKFEILYFFNLNCSTCIRFEKFINPWFKKHSKNVSIRAIPSPVRTTWQLANNTYFATKMLNPSLSFWDIMSEQENNKKVIYDYPSAESFIQQFSKHSSDDVASALFSDNAFNLADYSKSLYERFDCDGTPTLILIAKNHHSYKISPEFTNTFPEMLTVLDALISFNSLPIKNK